MPIKKDIILFDAFSGVGGFHLAIKQAGFNIVKSYHSDIEKYQNDVYTKIFPDSKSLEDITKINWNNTKQEIKDIDADLVITGGFPCTDISVAGHQKGMIDEEGNITRSGLWFELANAVEKLQPRWCLFENVAALIGNGLDNVLVSLNKIGYNCNWQIISAKAVGAWHLRKRIWITAYKDENPINEGLAIDEKDICYIEDNKIIFNAINNKSLPDNGIMTGTKISRLKEFKELELNILEMYPTPNTMDSIDAKPLKNIVKYNQKARPGRSYASMNLREFVMYGNRDIDGSPLNGYYPTGKNITMTYEEKVEKLERLKKESELNDNNILIPKKYDNDTRYDVSDEQVMDMIDNIKLMWIYSEILLDNSYKMVFPTPVANEGPGSMALKLHDLVAYLLRGIKPTYYKGDLKDIMDKYGIFKLIDEKELKIKDPDIYLTYRKMFSTPTKSDERDRNKTENWNGNDLPSSLEIPKGRHLSPDWVEWLMRYPKEYTNIDCEPDHYDWIGYDPSLIPLPQYVKLYDCYVDSHFPINIELNKFEQNPKKKKLPAEILMFTIEDYFKDNPDHGVTPRTTTIKLNRSNRLKCLGNSIVPLCAYQVFIQIIKGIK